MRSSEFTDCHGVFFLSAFLLLIFSFFCKTELPCRREMSRLFTFCGRWVSALSAPEALTFSEKEEYRPGVGAPCRCRSVRYGTLGCRKEAKTGEYLCLFSLFVLCFVVSFQVKFVGYGGFFILYILWLRCRNG